MADDDEIILSELSDDELVLQMHDDLYDGLKEEIEEAVNILIARGWAPYDALTKALVAGMTIVGADFRDGILFVPEGWHGHPEAAADCHGRTAHGQDGDRHRQG
jgi:methanogenic corrinoid protein MtbC1